MNVIKKKFLSKLYSGYGFRYYPKKFKINFDLKHKFIFSKRYIKIRNTNSRIILLASEQIRVSPNNIWNKNNFNDRENLSSLHRWTWVIKFISKKKNLSIEDKKFIEDSILNWCLRYSNKKINKNDIIFEPYNISERISNYLVLLKLKILQPNNFVLSILEKQFFFLMKNIEIYKFKKSNHALNNLKAIYMFSIYSENSKLQNYSLTFIVYILKKFLDKNGFFKFGSSNYQFIFAKWILDILLFSSNLKNKDIKFIENNFQKILVTLNFFLQKERNYNTIPLFGNISPDVSNKWIISFFFNRKKNFFFKKYWQKLNLVNTNKRISSKEWIKIYNHKFTVFCRNPKIVGFDFNHSHNDFFNFELFYYGKKIILNPGRENYSYKSLIRDISGGSHNSFKINNKPIYDEFLFYKPLSRIGIKKIQDCNYTAETNYKNYIKLNSLEKNYSIIREIFLNNKSVTIKDTIKTKKKSDIELRFNLSLTKEEFYEKKNLEILYSSDIKKKINFKNRKFYENYGEAYTGRELRYSFKNIDKLNSTLKVIG